jgi:hypothetical protein
MADTKRVVLFTSSPQAGQDQLLTLRPSGCFHSDRTRQPFPVIRAIEYDAIPGIRIECSNVHGVELALRVLSLHRKKHGAVIGSKMMA